MGKFEDTIEDALFDVIDPELEINIVDLGLIRKLSFNSQENTIDLTMTLTSAACPLGPELESQIREALVGLSENGPRIEWEFSPPWTIDEMTESGRSQWLSLGGFLPTY